MPPLFLLIKPVSGRCNLSCDYCFYTDATQKRAEASPDQMDLSTLERLVQSALEYADGQCGFAFQGGEPTLAGLPFFQAVVALQKKHNHKQLRIHNSIQTNAYHLEDKLISFFKENKFLVGVSLDGSQTTHDLYRKTSKQAGSFDQVLENLGKLKSAGVDTNLLCVVHQAVAQAPREVFSSLQKYQYLQFIACMEPQGAKSSPYSLTTESYAHFLVETFNLYYQAFLSGRFVSVRNFDNYLKMLLGQPPENCAMNGRCRKYYMVEADGSLFPCDFYSTKDECLGSIHEASFLEREGCVRHKAFLERSWLTHPDCAACRWYPLCRGGCQKDRIAVPGSPIKKNRWCAAYMAFFESCLPQMEHMATLLSK